MTEKQILEKKQYGDITEVAKILGVSRHNATMILRRPTSKKHSEAMDALTQIVEDREKRTAEARKRLSVDKDNN